MGVTSHMTNKDEIILKAAKEVFVRKGYGNGTMQNIEGQVLIHSMLQ